jgi:hypothetical protein
MTKAKRAGNLAQVIEHLPNKHKALSSTPYLSHHLKKKKKKKEKKKRMAF